MKKHARVLIFYKSKNSDQKNPYQAGGLAANALHSVAVLREMGVVADICQVENYGALLGTLCRIVSSQTWQPLTHVIVEALWVTPEQVACLADLFPDITFVYRAHSKMGFLQVEPQSILTMKKIIELSKDNDRIFFCSNNEEFAQSINEVYGKCLYLPNLYDLSSAPSPQHHSHHDHPHSTYRIASFGASRLLKLHPSAALASLQIGKRLERPVYFYVNSDSTPGGGSVRSSVKNIFAGEEPNELVEVGWQDTETFKKTIAYMDLVIQLSATETFCMVAADAVASGVPVVVGPAISWVPSAFRVNIDNTSDAAETGTWVLRNRAKAVRHQQAALVDFVEGAKHEWACFLGLKKKGCRQWFKLFR